MHACACVQVQALTDSFVSLFSSFIVKSSQSKRLLGRSPYGRLMWYIIVLLVALGVLAARKGKGRRPFRRFIRGIVDEELPLLTLASKTVVGIGFDNSVNERTWISSVRATWTLKGLPPVDGDGPIQVGLAHSDYSDAEIEEWIENAASWNEGDLVAQEVGKRKIRSVGVFQSAASVDEDSVLNDGKPITTKCGWILLQGQTLKQWAYNLGSGAMTTGGQVLTNGTANLWPQ